MRSVCGVRRSYEVMLSTRRLVRELLGVFHKKGAIREANHIQADPLASLPGACDIRDVKCVRMGNLYRLPDPQGGG